MSDEGLGVVRLGHGGGGLLSQRLLREVVLPGLHGEREAPAVLEDAAVEATPSTGRIAVTTDGFVVDPLFFPGGCIGDLAVNGTVNDLAMMGARPTVLTVAFIIEEGLAIETLREVARAAGAAARRAGARIVAGDTKVVPRGKGGGLYIVTSGIGQVPDGLALSAAALVPGDRIVVSGPIGDHGVAVLSRRAGLSFEADVRSDTAPLAGLVAAMVEAAPGLHALRDPTRGGLAAVLAELAEASGVVLRVEESALPVRGVVRAACEVLGLDPLHVPCEGRLVAAVDAASTGALLEAMARDPLGEGAVVIGEVVGRGEPVVTLRTRVGGERLVDLPAGELLPRIC